jgi:hypothetical protein
MDEEVTVEMDSLGTKRWTNKEGKLHRLDGPAIEYAGGAKKWYQNGLLHRLGGPAREFEDGHKEWWINGALHREDGPAIEYLDGYKAWYKNGVLHRLDGPVTIFPNGEKEWRINNTFLETKEDYFNALPDEAKIRCLFSEDFLNG